MRDTFDLARPLQLADASDVLSLRMGTTVAGTIRGFVPDDRVAQMLDHFTQYVGSSPDGSPAVLCAHRATCRPTKASGIPMGGTRAVPRRW